MARLFGTDGVRGVAGVDLTADLAIALGHAAGEVCAAAGRKVVVGRDTRLSGPMLEEALVQGLRAAGAHVELLGVIPTPAVSWLTSAEGAAAGAMISASHNPVEDNGIKFFGPGGSKTDELIEAEIERLVEERAESLPEQGRVATLPDASDRYVQHLLAASGDLSGLKVVLDCAYGAAWSVAPEAFRRAGAEVIAIHDEPDGARINVACGSTNLTELARIVVDRGADLGFGFDGDADRALAVDEAGREVGGDQILAMCALELKAENRLKNNTLIATVMSNLGFRRFLEAEGISVVAVPVGDKHVAAAMVTEGAVLGGEQSGHVIFGEHAVTGDGTLTALQVAGSVKAAGKKLSELAHLYDPWPQELINVQVVRRGSLDNSEPVWEAVRAAEKELGDSGRVLVRASGTEPLVRVMVESESAALANSTAMKLADLVRAELA